MDEVTLNKLAERLEAAHQRHAASVDGTVTGVELELEVRMGTCWFTNPTTSVSTNKEVSKSIHERQDIPFYQWRYDRFKPDNSPNRFFSILNRLIELPWIARMPWLQTEDVYYKLGEHLYRHTEGGGERHVLIPKEAIDVCGADDHIKMKMLDFFANDRTTLDDNTLVNCDAIQLIDNSQVPTDELGGISISNNVYTIPCTKKTGFKAGFGQRTPTDVTSVMKKQSLFGAFIGSANCDMPDFHIQLASEATTKAKLCHTRTYNQNVIANAPKAASASTPTTNGPPTFVASNAILHLQPDCKLFTRHKCRTSFFISLAMSNVMLYGGDEQLDGDDARHLIPYWRVDLTMMWRSIPHGISSELVRHRIAKYLHDLCLNSAASTADDNWHQSVPTGGNSSFEKNNQPPTCEIELECIDKSFHEHMLYDRYLNNGGVPDAMTSFQMQKLVIEEIFAAANQIFAPDACNHGNPAMYRCWAME
jgi:hypothetical protein